MPDRRRFLEAAVALPALWLPPGVSAAARIHTLSGSVYVNQRRIDARATISPGDAIVTAADALLEFSLGGDAFRVGPRSALQLEGHG
ncbi:MAG: hypothetical protein RLW62_02310, partial [Gammaproteobacteria bacterium]